MDTLQKTDLWIIEPVTIDLPPSPHGSGERRSAVARKGRSMDLNKVTIIGNLTRDPEAKSLPSGQPLSAFTIATNRQWQDAKTRETKEATDFHAIVAWGKLAEIIAKYVRKGSKVYVEGRLNTRFWQDKTGQRRARTEVVADNLIMLGHRAKNEKEEKAPAELMKEEANLEDVPIEA